MSTSTLASSRRRRTAAVAALILCAASTWALAASTIKADSLTIGSDLTYPPYAYMEAGKPVGFDADFSRLLAAKLSLKPVFVDTRFPDLILGMRARRFDAIASALYVTSERSKLIDFIPYLKTGASLVVLAASPYAPPSPEALCGKRVASIKGASWTPKLRKVSRETCRPKGEDEIKVLEFPTSPEAMMALRSQAADVMIEDAAVVHGMLAQSQNSLKVTSTSLLYPIVIGLGLHKEAQQLQGELKMALQRAHDSGEYQALLTRYGLEAPTAAEVQSALIGTSQ
ncbi:ABC transporter substrate-binding protein [Cupriavidus sp. 2TAF22]|uniref:ABC transporter substrate-binding protein n=1 Tax=unclassified Cupriavidus TaxID=2640874 RepID=UPI003F91AB29